jgi:HD-GYP domain-containing protein (c-di-GMP phosphodiesterase class II)
MTVMDFDSYSTPEGESLLRSARERFTARALSSRVLRTEFVAAAVCLGLAVALAVVGSSPQRLSVSRLVITAVAFLCAAHVRFPVAAGWTRPTQLMFVPMLFLLPTQIAPLVVIGCLVIQLCSEFPHHRVSLTRVLAVVADGAYALGPAFVLIVAHDQRFAWNNWPIYAVAFLAQIAVDLAGYIARSWFAERTLPSAQMQVAWTYLTDGCLSCIALIVVASAVRRPGLLLLTLPMMAVFGLFAREREQRLDSTLELSSAYRGTAALLSDVIEADHEYTGLHSREVVDLSLAVADALGLSGAQRVNVEFGALLHDVGEIRVAPQILDKPGSLDPTEWAIMQQHTIVGQEMLEQVGGTLARVGEIVRSSHEHFDGSGYPDQLTAAEIPIESRIISACDAYNAMTTTRSYRPAMPRPAARDELLRCAGTQFDPAVIAVIVRELGLL